MEYVGQTLCCAFITQQHYSIAHARAVVTFTAGKVLKLDLANCFSMKVLPVNLPQSIPFNLASLFSFYHFY